MKFTEVYDKYGAFTPNSGGNIEQLTQIAKESIFEIFPRLICFSQTFLPRINKKIDINPPIILNLCEDQHHYNNKLDKLNQLFDSHRSDKHYNNYSSFYAFIINESFTNIFEIGLGTNNEDVVSNMGKDGNPGSSIKAFRDFLPNTNCYAADVDKRILFTEERIETFYVDQMNPQTFVDLSDKLPDSFDMIIDDGLHCILANLNSMIFALPKLKSGGWFVIEDIFGSSSIFFEFVSGLLDPDQYRCYQYYSTNDINDLGAKLLWAIQKI